MTAERDNEKANSRNTSLFIAVAKARVWASEGWQVVVTDGTGKTFTPDEFEGLCGFPAPKLQHFPAKPPASEAEQPAAETEPFGAKPFGAKVRSTAPEVALPEAKVGPPEAEAESPEAEGEPLVAAIEQPETEVETPEVKQSAAEVVRPASKVERPRFEGTRSASDLLSRVLLIAD
jgi:hypothetical protein